jgi:hypothetical protein
MLTPEETYAALVFELVEALKKVFAKDTPNFPGLVLLYASIDIISSLSRPINLEDTTRPVFKNWVTTYMLSDSGLKCSAADIYAARCGILHTLSLSSQLSRDGHAKQISYLNKQSGVDRLQKICDSKGHNVVVVSIYNYTHAFYNGILRFTENLKTDAELRARVFHHVGSVAAQISFSFRD